MYITLKNVLIRAAISLFVFCYLLTTWHEHVIICVYIYMHNIIIILDTLNCYSAYQLTSRIFICLNVNHKFYMTVDFHDRNLPNRFQMHQLTSLR